MEKTIFFIDGGYLSFISKFLGRGRLLKNRIEKFAERVAKERKLDIGEIYFYTAMTRFW